MHHLARPHDAGDERLGVPRTTAARPRPLADPRRHRDRGPQHDRSARRSGRRRLLPETRRSRRLAQDGLHVLLMITPPVETDGWKGAKSAFADSSSRQIESAKADFAPFQPSVSTGGAFRAAFWRAAAPGA